MNKKHCIDVRSIQLKFDSIIFDFDGVLVESVDIKSQAFAELYAPYGQEIVRKVIRHHVENGGMSRFEKFSHYHQTFLGLQYDEVIALKLGQDFSRLVEDKVVGSPYVRGATEFLEKYCRHLNFFVASGTPHDELIRIMNRRCMAHYFVSAYGSPPSKAQIIDGILMSRNLKAYRTLMVGDSITDYEAAIKTGVRFIWRLSHLNTQIPLGIPTVNDLSNLEIMIKDHVT